MAFRLAAYVSRCWLPVTAQGWLPGAGQALLDGLSPAGLLQKVFNSLHVRWPPFPSFLAQSRFSVPTIDVWWQGWGHPNYATEPSFQWVALRSSLNIWNQVDVQLSASGGTASCTVVSFLGSAFPSRKLWINSVLVASFGQGAFSDLWQPDPTDPSWVAQ
jgi:hypothetical protein